MFFLTLEAQSGVLTAYHLLGRDSTLVSLDLYLRRNITQKLYARRDAVSLGEFYVRHVEAMTAEALHSKSAIAAELAWRDQEIARLATIVAAYEARTSRYIADLTLAGDCPLPVEVARPVVEPAVSAAAVEAATVLGTRLLVEMKKMRPLQNDFVAHDTGSEAWRYTGTHRGPVRKASLEFDTGVSQHADAVGAYNQLIIETYQDQAAPAPASAPSRCPAPYEPPASAPAPYEPPASTPAPCEPPAPAPSSDY